LQQILVNLAGNAIKFTAGGEVVVSVAREATTDEGVRLHFTVRDTGIGIPAEKQAKIFEAFSQADASTSRRFGGTGLGLAISTQLVSLMDGEIWVESEPGKGTIFHFTVHLRLSAKQARRRPPADLEGTPVLIVDDNATNRRILHEITQSWGMKPHSVEGGRAALEALDQSAAEARSIPLVLFDYLMPEMDGLEFAREVRRRAALEDVSLIMLTSAGAPDNSQQLEELRVERCLTKPTKRSDLLNAVQQTLGAPAVEAPAEAAASPARPGDVPALRILLAEDNPINQRVAVGLLEKRGHRVMVVNDGREAVAALEREEFDAVLMDVHMPELDGFQATRAIRQRERRAGGHTPIIAMTASAMQADQDECLAAGMDGFVSKPVHAAELYAALENARDDSSAIGEEPVKRQVSAAAEDGDIIDWGAALRRVDGDRAELRELAKIFRDLCPKMVRDIQEAIAQEDARLLQRTAHTLKGNADLFSADRVVQIAWKLETMGKARDFDNAAGVSEELATEIECLLPVLGEFCEAK
jgi:two-component system, sensor histidine kinase and response regulator